jgi:hypothetical protein
MVVTPSVLPSSSFTETLYIRPAAVPERRGTVTGTPIVSDGIFKK